MIFSRHCKYISKYGRNNLLISNKWGVLVFFFKCLFMKHQKKVLWMIKYSICLAFNLFCPLFPSVPWMVYILRSTVQPRVESNHFTPAAITWGKCISLCTTPELGQGLIVNVFDIEAFLNMDLSTRFPYVGSVDFK